MSTLREQTRVAVPKALMMGSAAGATRGRKAADAASDVWEPALRELLSAASCYVQCSDLARGQDRATCQSMLSDTVLKLREML